MILIIRCDPRQLQVGIDQFVTAKVSEEVGSDCFKSSDED